MSVKSKENCALKSETSLNPDGQVRLQQKQMVTKIRVMYHSLLLILRGGGRKSVSILRGWKNIETRYF